MNSEGWIVSNWRRRHHWYTLHCTITQFAAILRKKLCSVSTFLYYLLLQIPSIYVKFINYSNKPYHPQTFSVLSFYIVYYTKNSQKRIWIPVTFEFYIKIHHTLYQKNWINSLIGLHAVVCKITFSFEIKFAELSFLVAHWFSLVPRFFYNSQFLRNL